MSAIQRVPTGISKLDSLIEGGFPTDSMVLVVGHPGAGKSTLAGQFVYNGAVKSGLKSVYACFAETKDTFFSNMLRFEWDFERLERERRVAVLDLAVTREAGIQTNLNSIMETMSNFKASILVIDSFTAISMALKEYIDSRVMIHLFYRFLKKSNCMSLFIIDQAWGSTAIGERVAEFMADGILHLETYFDEEGTLRRTFNIIKMRGTNRSKSTYEYEISKKGFTLLDLSKLRKP